jgi:hypothetical protein
MTYPRVKRLVARLGTSSLGFYWKGIFIDYANGKPLTLRLEP